MQLKKQMSIQMQKVVHEEDGVESAQNVDKPFMSDMSSIMIQAD